jgi:hypothetical protein
LLIYWKTNTSAIEAAPSPRETATWSAAPVWTLWEAEVDNDGFVPENGVVMLGWAEELDVDSEVDLTSDSEAVVMVLVGTVFVADVSAAAEVADVAVDVAVDGIELRPEASVADDAALVLTAAFSWTEAPGESVPPERGISEE